MTTYPFPRRQSPLLGLVEIISNRTWRLKRDQWDGGPGIVAHDAAGRPHDTDPLQVSLLAQPPEFAAALGEGPVIERKRRHLIGGVPWQLSWSYYRADTGAAQALLAADTGPGGAPARLAEAGLAPVPERKREAVTARLARRDERAALGGLPGLSVVQVVVRHWPAADGTVVEVTRMVIAPGCTLVYEGTA